MEMSNTSFFLTGCASGMGRRLAGAFLARGARVFATDINEESLRKAAKEDLWPLERVRLRRVDVTSHADVEAAFAGAVEAFGGIDVVMNIAGLLLSSWVVESPLRETDAQIDVNIKGVVYGTQIAARHMVARGRGHIINIASIAGVIPVPGLSVYAATKHAVRAFSLSAALELQPKGVHVTVICPDTVQTPMLDNQESVGAAEMYFSGMRILTVKDIEKAVFKALRRRPYEVHLPWLKLKMVQVIGLFPWIGPYVAPLYQWNGRRRMAKRNKAKR